MGIISSNNVVNDYFINNFLSEILSLGDGTSFMNLIHMHLFDYSLKSSNVSSISSGSYSSFLANQTNQNSLLTLDISDLIGRITNNAMIGTILTILDKLLIVNSNKLIYQQQLKQHILNLSLVYTHSNLSNSIYFICNINTLLFTQTLFTSQLLLYNINDHVLNIDKITNNLLMSLRVIQYSCEYQNPFFKSLIYRTCFSHNTPNSYIFISLIDLLLSSIHLIGKFYLLNYDNVYDSSDGSVMEGHSKRLLKKNSVIGQIEHDITKSPKSNKANLNIISIHSLHLIRLTKHILQLYQSYYDTLIEIIQGSNSNLIDSLCSAREDKNLIDQIKPQDQNTTFSKDNIRTNNKGNLTSSEVFKGFLFSIKEIIFKCKNSQFNLSDLRNIEYKYIKKNIFLFINSILEQNFKHKQIIKNIQINISKEEIKSDIYLKVNNLIECYSNSNISKLSIIDKLTTIEKGELMSLLITISKEKKNYLSKIFEKKNSNNNLTTTIIPNSNNVISKDSTDTTTDSQISNDDKTIMKSYLNNYFEFLRVMFIYTKLMTQLYNTQTCELTEASIDNINHYFLHKYISIEIKINKEYVYVYFEIPSGIEFLSNSTKANMLDSIDRETSLSKISTFLNEENFLAIQNEINFFKKVNKDRFEVFKWVNDWEMWYFECINFIISLITNVILLLTVKVNEINYYSYTIQFICAIQTLYSIVYITLWIYYKYCLKFELYLDINKNQSRLNIAQYHMNNLILNKELFTFISVVILNLCFLHNNDYFYLLGFHLLIILNLSQTLNSILSAIVSKTKQISITVMFLFIVVLCFTIIGFYLLPEEFEYDDGKSNYCETYFSCFLFIIDFGLRSGGGIGDVLNKKSLTNERNIFWGRFTYDILFWLIVILMMLNIIMGIVIDTFSELREKIHKEDDDKENTCMICGKKRDYFDKFNKDFNHHLSVEHNPWNYFLYIIYIKDKDMCKRNSHENYVWNCYKIEDFSWVPNEEIIENESKTN